MTSLIKNGNKLIDSINNANNSPATGDDDSVLTNIADSREANAKNNGISSIEDEKKVENTGILKVLNEAPINTSSAKVEIPTNKENNTSPDKQINGKKFSLDKLIAEADLYANWAAILANVTGAFIQLLKLPESFKLSVAKLVDGITNFSFMPYGLDGMRIAGKEKKNLLSAIGYGFEVVNVWLSNLKTKYLIRGLGTGLDQIWVATDKRLSRKTNGRISEGRFGSWTEGVVETLKECGTMIKEICIDPMSTVFNLKADGYHALLSTIGSATATIGYALTGKEKIFGTIRDVSAALFDWEMVLSEDPKQKASGFLFIAESVLDFVARFMPSESSKLFINQLSHASGRSALKYYKSSDPNAKVAQDKQTKAEVKEDDLSFTPALSI